jgi:hypothetical protein
LAQAALSVARAAPAGAVVGEQRLPAFRFLLFSAGSELKRVRFVIARLSFFLSSSLPDLIGNP